MQNTRDEQIFSFIQTYQQKHLVAPTLREIEDGLGFVKSNVRDHLKQMDEAGWLTYTPHIARGISLQQRPLQTFEDLERRSLYWLELDCSIVWVGNPETGCYTGFKAYWKEPFALAQEVSIQETVKLSDRSGVS